MPRTECPDATPTSAGYIAIEPSREELAVLRAQLLMQGTIAHGITPDPHQFRPPVVRRDDVEGSTQRVEQWFADAPTNAGIPDETATGANVFRAVAGPLPPGAVGPAQDEMFVSDSGAVSSSAPAGAADSGASSAGWPKCAATLVAASARR